MFFGFDFFFNIVLEPFEFLFGFETILEELLLLAKLFILIVGSELILLFLHTFKIFPHFYLLIGQLNFFWEIFLQKYFFDLFDISFLKIFILLTILSKIFINFL